MKTGKKISREFLSEETHQQLQVIKPYWVARNFIPQIIKQKCDRHHDAIKLPLIKDFLKKGQYKVYTEQNGSKQNIALSSQKINYKYPSEYTLTEQRKGIISNSKQPKIIKHNSIMEQLQGQNYKLKQYQKFKQLIEKQQNKNGHHEQSQGYTSEYIPQIKQHTNRNSSLNSNQFLNLPNLSNLSRLSRIHKQSLFSPLLSDRSIMEYQKQKAEENKNQNKSIKNVSKLIKQQNLIKEERFSILAKNETSQSSLIYYDKVNLLEQYAITAKLLQATINKQQKGRPYANSKKIMSLMATLNILKRNMESHGMSVSLQRYLVGVSANIVKQMQRILDRSSEYQQIFKQIEQKFHERDLVVKKIKKTQIQKQDSTIRLGKHSRRDTNQKDYSKQNRNNRDSVVSNLKKHYRYQSDSILLQKHIQQQQDNSDNRISKDKQIIKKRQLQNVNKTKRTLPQIGLKNKQNSQQQLSKGKIKRIKKPTIIPAKQSPKFDKQKLERIKNKNKNKRPKSHKTIGMAEVNNTIHSFFSQKLLNTQNTKKSIRTSFRKFIRSRRNSVKKSKGATNSNSKYQSSVATPELILQIQDNLSSDQSQEHQNQSKSKLKNPNRNKDQINQDQDQRTSSHIIPYKNVSKAKINRFHMDLCDDIRIPTPSSDESESSQQNYSPRKKKRTEQQQEGVDWNNIVRRVPKKKMKLLKRQDEERRRLKHTSFHLNSRIMLALHRSVYKILEDRSFPQLKQIRDILMQNQKKIIQMRLKQQYISQTYNVNQQKWINGLDFNIKISTNHRQHIGGSKTSKIIVRNDVESDPVQLYQIACRQSQISQRLQQKERLERFLQQSIKMLQKSQCAPEIYSYEF